MATKIFNRTTAATCTALASLAAVGFTWNQQRQWRSTHLDAAQQSHNAALKLDNDPPARKPISTWKPPQRQDVLQSMKSGEEYDLLIIGGGATGKPNYYHQIS
jgi:hypothetical protein